MEVISTCNAILKTNNGAFLSSRSLSHSRTRYHQSQLGCANMVHPEVETVKYNDVLDGATLSSHDRGSALERPDNAGNDNGGSQLGNDIPTALATSDPLQARRLIHTLRDADAEPRYATAALSHGHPCANAVFHRIRDIKARIPSGKYIRP